MKEADAETRNVAGHAGSTRRQLPDVGGEDTMRTLSQPSKGRGGARGWRYRRRCALSLQDPRALPPHASCTARAPSVGGRVAKNREITV